VHDTIADYRRKRGIQRLYICSSHRALLAKNPPCDPPQTPANRPCPSDAVHPKNASLSMLPIWHREPRCSWAGSETVHPALSRRNMPFRGQHLHLAMHHDRPIIVSSLDCRRRREKLRREGLPIAERKGSHDHGYCSIRSNRAVQGHQPKTKVSRRLCALPDS
jgi:hypothetical protein